MPAFPYESCFQRVDQESVMNHFAHRAAKAIKISRNFSTAREMVRTPRRAEGASEHSPVTRFSCYSLGAENLITCPGFCSQLSVAVLPHCISEQTPEMSWRIRGFAS